MSTNTKYTLTRKGAVIGPDYHHNRGDVISQKQYDALIPRHKDQFEEGAVDIFRKQTPKEKAATKTIEELTSRIEALEAVVFAANTQETEKEPAKTKKK